MLPRDVDRMLRASTREAVADPSVPRLALPAAARLYVTGEEVARRRLFEVSAGAAAAPTNGSLVALLEDGQTTVSLTDEIALRGHRLVVESRAERVDLVQ